MTKDILPKDVVGGNTAIVPTLIELIAPEGFSYTSIARSMTEGTKYAFNSDCWIGREAMGNIDDDRMELLPGIASPQGSLAAEREAALRKEPDKDDLYLDATIQRFEFCFELAWKLMKAVLSDGGIEVSSPRASIREGWKQGLVQEAEAWLDMLEKRNLSAHTYNEQTAQVIYAAVKGKYFAMLAAFDEDVEARLAVMQEVFR